MNNIRVDRAQTNHVIREISGGPYKRNKPNVIFFHPDGAAPLRSERSDLMGHDIDQVMRVNRQNYGVKERDERKTHFPSDIIPKSKKKARTVNCFFSSDAIVGTKNNGKFYFTPPIHNISRWRINSITTNSFGGVAPPDSILVHSTKLLSLGGLDSYTNGAHGSAIASLNPTSGADTARSYKGASDEWYEVGGYTKLSEIDFTFTDPLNASFSFGAANWYINIIFDTYDDDQASIGYIGRLGKRM